MLSRMDEQLEFVKRIAHLLESAEIPYMVTGSVAMAVYAQPRMTRDVDLVIECQTGDVERLVHLLETDCYVDAQAVGRAVTSRSMFNAIHREWIIKADFIIRKDEPYRRLEFERRKRLEIDGMAVWVVSPEDLILSKLSWARDSESAQQVRDVRALLESGLTIDGEYLDTWARTLSVDTTLADLRSP
jgi:predicted nucleotidyltransferase